MRLEIRQQRSGISSQNNFRNHHFQIERNQPISERQKDREIIAASPKQEKTETAIPNRNIVGDFINPASL